MVLFRRRRKGKVQMIFLVMMAMTMMRKKKKKNMKKTQTMHKLATRTRSKSNNNSRSSNNTNAKVQRFFSQLMHGNWAIQLGVERMFEWDLHDRNDANYLCGSSSSRRIIIIPTLIRLTGKKEEDPGISSVSISRMLAVCRWM